MRCRLFLLCCRCTCFWSFCSVLGTTLATTIYAGGIERTAHEVITYTRKVLYTTAADEYDRVFLQVVAFARNVGIDLLAVR